jgi:hypothetical protein
MVPPLQIDYVNGFWRGTLVSSYEITDDVAEGDSHFFKHEFK